MTRIFEGIIGFPRSCIPPLDAYNAIYNQLFKNAEEKKNNDEPEQVAQWREQYRKEFGIAPQTMVYCYNGSAKAWQHPAPHM